tara:strand:+ start:16273 stop:17403 length:1131 start_codon:yes stop_codon:yes gene_type:complete
MVKTIICLVGTRPELIKMSRVISKFDKYTNLILVHTGQNYDYELNQVFFEELGLKKPDYFLDAARDTSAKTIAAVIEKTDDLLEKLEPDAALIYGDTNSCLSVIAFKKRKIPIFHMEAGNRCFDQRVPEEVNRKIVDHLSDINLVLTEHARRYLINEGIKAETIFKTGSHMYEILNFYKKQIDESHILKKLNLKRNSYFIVSLHREENVDDESNLTAMLDSLNQIAKKYLLPVIVSTHPRTKKRLDQLFDKKFDQNIVFLKPFGFFDYIQLQMNAKCVISDSGTITEESSILKFPAITIRNNHERPEGMDAGTLIMSGLQSENVLNCIEISIDQGPKSIGDIREYENKNLSDQILKIVLSYIEYVNDFSWKKFNKK